MAVHLTRIYTKTGDTGTTALGDMSRVAKTDPRVAAYGDTDECNAAIGVALALGALPEPGRAVLTRIQNDLFDVGADLAPPARPDPAPPAWGSGYRPGPPRGTRGAGWWPGWAGRCPPSVPPRSRRSTALCTSSGNSPRRCPPVPPTASPPASTTSRSTPVPARTSTP